MSYLEIYNEHIRDLLAPDNGTLDLRDDSKKGIHVAGLTEASTTSTKEVKCRKTQPSFIMWSLNVNVQDILHCNYI